MRVRIVRRPMGQAPEWVRDAWVGVEFESHMGQDDILSGQRGALGGPAQIREGHHVIAGVALEALSGRNHEAADWWRDTAHLSGATCLIFDAEACRVIP